MLIDVPNGRDLNQPWLTLRCRKRFCRMGCLCESLNSTKILPDHCKRPDCMLQCECVSPISKSDSVTPDQLIQSCDKTTAFGKVSRKNNLVTNN